jgi:hypothetical protein
MKNLWFTFLASLVLCGLSFVFNGSGERSVLKLKKEMKLSNLEMDKVIETFDFAIQETVFRHPQYMEQLQKWRNYREISSQELANVVIPKTKNEAAQFAKKWNDLNQKHIRICIQKKGAIEDKFKKLATDSGDDFYHTNKIYKEILKETLKMNAKSTETAIVIYFLNDQADYGLWFCSEDIRFPSNLKLQLGEKSEIPMVLDVYCPYYDGYQIKKLWINRQLVHQNKYDYILKNKTYDVIYNGEQVQTIKIEYQPNRNTTLTKERIYDFEINECD